MSEKEQIQLQVDKELLQQLIIISNEFNIKDFKLNLKQYSFLFFNDYYLETIFTIDKILEQNFIAQASRKLEFFNYLIVFPRLNGQKSIC
jgi:hypothetical protein